MITEIMKNLFTIELPFPNRRVNSIDSIRLVLVKGDDRWLLVDTGLNEPVYEETLRESLAELGVDTEKMDLFISHMHPDHSGLSYKFKTPFNHVYATEKEAAVINRTGETSYWDGIYNGYVHEGMLMDRDTFEGSYPPAKYLPEGKVAFDIVSEGDILSVGDYSFRCIVLPGHGSAHGCLYDSSRRLFIACDAILSDVPPILFLDEGLEDPLGAYMRSMDRMAELDVDTLIPCHGDVNFDLRTRIDEIRTHYLNMCNEIRADLTASSGLSAYELADLHTRRTFSRELSNFSPVSFWFFFIPMLACIRYLAADGVINGYDADNGIVKYSII